MKLTGYLKTNGLTFPYESEYATEYNENENIIKTIMNNKYGQLNLRFDVAETDSVIMATLFQYKYKFDKLWDTTKVTYNPLWNVEGTETTTTTYGEREITRNYGEKVSENVYGEKTKTSTLSSYPYDTQVETPTNKENLVDNENTDIFTDTEHTDTDTSKEYTDTVTVKREGNIGVTTSQHLLTEERNVANFSFWNVVIDTVVKEITVPYYKESEVNYNACCFW